VFDLLSKIYFVALHIKGVLPHWLVIDHWWCIWNQPINSTCTPPFTLYPWLQKYQNTWHHGHKNCINRSWKLFSCSLWKSTFASLLHFNPPFHLWRLFFPKMGFSFWQVSSLLTLLKYIFLHVQLYNEITRWNHVKINRKSSIPNLEIKVFD
jgi:hypothetical protein